MRAIMSPVEAEPLIGAGVFQCLQTPFTLQFFDTDSWVTAGSADDPACHSLLKLTIFRSKKFLWGRLLHIPRCSVTRP